MSGELTLVINVLPEGIQPLLQNIRGFSNEHMTGRVSVSRVYQVESSASPGGPFLPHEYGCPAWTHTQTLYYIFYNGSPI